MTGFEMGIIFQLPFLLMTFLLKVGCLRELVCIAYIGLNAEFTLTVPFWKQTNMFLKRPSNQFNDLWIL